MDQLIVFAENDNPRTTAAPGPRPAQRAEEYLLINSTLLEALDLYKAAQVVNLYLPPIIIVFGCCVNIMSILVMRSHYFRYVSTSCYMTAGAINDSTSLLVALLPHWLFVNYDHIYTRGMSADRMCKFFNFYGFSNTDFTMVLTAFMTADRAYAIKFPIEVATSNMVKRANVIIVVGAIIISIKNFHLWFCSAMSPPENRERLCVVQAADGKFQFFLNEVWPWIHIGFLGISLLVVLVSNSLIISNVKQSASMSESNGHASGGNRAQTRRESVVSHGSMGKRRQITVMMLAESFTTLVLSYPFAWYMALSNKDPDLHRLPDKMAMNQLLFSVFFYMLYSNKCVNFFLYFVSGYKFRLALKQVFTWHRQRYAETAHELQHCCAQSRAHDVFARGSLSTMTSVVYDRTSSGKRSENGDAGDDVTPLPSPRRHSVSFCLQNQVSGPSVITSPERDGVRNNYLRVGSGLDLWRKNTQRRPSTATCSLPSPLKLVRKDGCDGYFENQPNTSKSKLPNKAHSSGEPESPNKQNCSCGLQSPSKPNSASEPKSSNKQNNASEPISPNKPNNASEPKSPNKPNNASEPKSPNQPNSASEPKSPDNPSSSSAPKSSDKANCSSEPKSPIDKPNCSCESTKSPKKKHKFGTATNHNSKKNSSVSKERTERREAQNCLTDLSSKTTPYLSKSLRVAHKPRRASLPDFQTIWAPS